MNLNFSGYFLTIGNKVRINSKRNTQEASEHITDYSFKQPGHEVHIYDTEPKSVSLLEFILNNHKIPYIYSKNFHDLLEALPAFLEKQKVEEYKAEFIKEIKDRFENANQN